MKTGCPHCGQQAVTPLRKLFAGPVQTLTCQHCGTRLGVPYLQAFISITPFVIAVLIGTAGRVSSSTQLVLWVGGFVLACVLYLWWVPLERK